MAVDLLSCLSLESKRCNYTYRKSLLISYKSYTWPQRGVWMTTRYVVGDGEMLHLADALREHLMLCTVA